MFTSRQQSAYDPSLCAHAILEAVRHIFKDLLGMLALAEFGDLSHLLHSEGLRGIPPGREPIRRGYG